MKPEAPVFERRPRFFSQDILGALAEEEIFPGGRYAVAGEGLFFSPVEDQDPVLVDRSQGFEQEGVGGGWWMY